MKCIINTRREIIAFIKEDTAYELFYNSYNSPEIIFGEKVRLVKLVTTK